MTTAAKLTALQKGHGLTGRLVNDAYTELAAGGKPEPIVVLAVLQPFKHSADIDGERDVTFKPTHVEPVPADEVARYRELLEELQADRNGYLPLDFGTRPEDEQRKALIERIEAWADEHGLTGKDVDEKWRDLLGSGDNAAGTYEKGSAQHLLQFAHSVGAVPEPETATTSDPTLDDAEGGE